MIVSLGGLEFTLCFLDRRAPKRDHELQNKQLEVMDGRGKQGFAAATTGGAK